MADNIRKVVLYELLSLDGVGEEPSDWVFEDGEELFANLARVIASQDDVLLGRGTYDYWVGYWPTSDVEPFATFINSTPKHVFTSSALTPEWPSTTVVTGRAVDYVADLKSKPGRDIGIHGSLTLAQSLLGAGLVDQLELVVSPVVAGGGRRLFPDSDGQQAFDLRDVQNTRNGSLLLSYQLAKSA